MSTGPTPPAVVRGRSTRASDDPEINIVNLSDHEFAVLSALRETGHGRIEVIVRDGQIVQINRSQHLRRDDRRGRAP